MLLCASAPPQNVMDDFVCALKKRILLQGRMYVFEHYVCFHSNVLGYVKNKIIPLKVHICPHAHRTGALCCCQCNSVHTRHMGYCTLVRTSQCRLAWCQQLNPWHSSTTAAVQALSRRLRRMATCPAGSVHASYQDHSFPERRQLAQASLVVPQEVTAVRKRKNVGFPNSIEITWGSDGKREFFTSFLSRCPALHVQTATFNRNVRFYHSFCSIDPKSIFNVFENWLLAKNWWALDDRAVMRCREDAYRLIMATWAQCSGYANLFNDSRGDDADASNSGARIRARACPEPCSHLSLLWTACTAVTRTVGTAGHQTCTAAVAAVSRCLHPLSSS